MKQKKKNFTDTDDVLLTDKDDEVEGEKVPVSGQEESCESSITSESGTKFRPGSDNKDANVDATLVAPIITSICKRPYKKLECQCKASNTK